jgi:dTDP-4-dehydrorhamnose 3,5-epimerase
MAMPYSVTETTIPDLLILEPRVFGDQRGFFYESFNQREFQRATGQNFEFVQDNHSKSAQGVLRGLHFQLHHPQGKLVRVIQGEVFDVAVDLRPHSNTLGHHVSVRLSQQNNRQLWIPPGFAHGFLVLSESAEFLYKTTDYWYAQHERSLDWNAPELKINWPLIDIGISEPVLAAKDKTGLSWDEALKEINNSLKTSSNI